MKRIFLFILFLIIGTQLIFSQQADLLLKDSLSVKGRFGLMGRWQTGNLNQVSLMPNGNISLRKKAHFAEFNMSYHFLKVNGFNAINDFWTYGLYQFQPSKKIFPSIHSILGFAKSYNIDHSIVTGIGGGINIHKKSPANFLQAHVFTTYLNFQYEAEKKHETIAISSLIKAIIPMNENINFQWEFSTYHSFKDRNFWGGGNLFRLNFKILKNLSMNINHQTYYNHQTTSNIKKLNTEMLFGIQYFFSNH